MTPQPRLIATRTPDEPRGVVLVLHGGGGRGTMPVSPHQLSVLRMIPIAGRAAKAGHGRLAVFRLLNAVRGIGSDPLSNVRWALGRIHDHYADVPVCLIGHSLGGSVALAAGGSVQGVVALAPWLSGSESVRQLAGTPTLIVHGTNDRVTSPSTARRYAATARAAGAGAPCSYVSVEGGEHTMLKKMPAFDELAARYARAVLEPAADGGGRWGALARQAYDDPGEYQA